MSEVIESNVRTEQCILVSAPYLCVLEVVSPQRSDLVLTTDIPNCEADVLVLNGLHIET